MKAYALLNLKTLRVYQFDHHNEIVMASQDLDINGTDTIILKWHGQAGTYLQPEVCNY